MLLFQRLLATCCTILIFTYTTLGQAVIQNKRFSYYSGNYSALNPAHMGISAEKQFGAQYLSFTGVRKIIKTVYLSGFYSVKESKSTFGLSAYSESQGRFLQDNSVVGTFGFKLFENSDQSLQAAGSFGAVNYIVKDNDFGFGGSDWGVDASLGLWYQYHNISAGLSYNHLFNTVLIPVNEQFALDRSLNFMIGYRHDFSNEIVFEPDLIIQNQSITGFRGQLINSVLYKNRFKGIISIHTEGMLGIGSAFENFGFENGGLFGLSFNLNLNLNNALVINSNQYELGLRYYFDE